MKGMKAIISINTFNMGKNITKWFPQGSRIRLLLWNIQYDTVLNLQFTHNTRAVAFADDMLLMIRVEDIREAEKLPTYTLAKL